MRWQRGRPTPIRGERIVRRRFAWWPIRLHTKLDSHDARRIEVTAWLWLSWYYETLEALQVIYPDGHAECHWMSVQIEPEE